MQVGVQQGRLIIRPISSDKFAVCLNNPLSGPISATPVNAGYARCLYLLFVICEVALAFYSDDVSKRRLQDTRRRYYVCVYL